MSEQEVELDYCFVVSTASGDGEVRVRTTGEVVHTFGSSDFISLDGIEFPTNPRPHLKLGFVGAVGSQVVGNVDRSLCHYTRASTALEFILKDKRLLLSSFDRTNDPRENRDWSFCVIAEQGRAPNGAAIEISKEMSRQLRQHARVVCFCADGRHPSEERVSLVDGQGWRHPRMWAQYGENYSGVVLVFDQRQLLANAQVALANEGRLLAGYVSYLRQGSAPTYWPWHVNYSEWASLGPADFTSKHLDSFGDWLFFSKHEDWSQEQEFRLLLLAKKPVQAFVPIQGALKEICVGHQMSGNTLANVVAAGAELNVPVTRVTWRNGVAWRLPSSIPQAK